MADPEPLLKLAEDRIISDIEETKCDVNEESNHERDKPRGDRTMNQAMRGETQGRTISDKEVEDEQHQNFSTKTCICSSTASKVTLPRKGFHDGSQRLSSSDFHRHSIGHHSLPSPKILQQQHEKEAPSHDSSRHWISTSSGKEVQNKFNQTSFIWERKPLSEILHPSSEISQRSEHAKSNVVAGKQDGAAVGKTENEQPLPQDYFQNSQVSEEEKAQSSTQESKQSVPPSTELETWEGEQHAEFEQAEGDGHLQSIEGPCLKSKMPSQLQQTDETSINSDVIWISPKTGKEVKSSTTQTNFFWDGKTLAEYLHSVSMAEEVLGPNTNVISPTEIKLLSMEEYPPQNQESDDWESHQNIQQPNGLVSQRGRQRSVEHHSLVNQTTFQLQQANEKYTMWIQQKTGQGVKCSTTQTNFFWDEKRLGECLQPPCTEGEMLNLDSKAVSSTETVSATAFICSSPPKAEQPFVPAVPLVTPESGKHDLSELPLFPTCGTQTSVEHHSLLSQTTSQLQQADKVSINEDTMWIQDEIGQDVRYSTTQTSFFWDGKRLMEYLQPPRKEGEMLSLESKAASSVDTVPRGPGTTFIFDSPSEAEQPFVPAISLVTPESEKHDLSELPLFPTCGTQPSVEHHSLVSQTLQLQQTNKPSIIEDTMWIRQKTGRDVKSSTTQTSLVWDGKRLVEHLHPTSKEGETTVSSSGDTVPLGPGTAFISSSPVVPLVTPESEKNDLSALTLFARRGTQTSIELQSLLSERTLQLPQTNKTGLGEDTMWIRQKTGQDVKCHTTQTNLFWDGKRLVEHLHPTSKEGKVLNFETTVSSSVDTVPLGPGTAFISSSPVVPLVTPESEKNDLSALTLFARRGTQTSGEHYSLLSQTTLQQHQTNKASPDENTMWIRQTTGRDVKCRTTQTSLVWDGKRLVEHLHPTSKEGEILNFETTVSSSEDTVPLGPGTAFISSSPVIPHVTPESEKNDLSALTLFARRGTQTSGEQYSLLSQRTLQQQQTNKASIDDNTMWIRQTTGRDVKCRTTQTSLFWDGKRLVEHLHPTSKEGKVLNFETTVSSSVDTVPLGPGTAFITSSPEFPLVTPESEKNDLSALTLFARRGTQPSIELQSLLSQRTPQLPQTNKASLGEDTMWIRQKTGRDVKCHTTQTNLFWDGKRLVEHLHLTSKEGKILNFETTVSSSVDTVPLGPGTAFISSSPAIPLVTPESEKNDLSALTLFARRGTQTSGERYSLPSQTTPQLQQTDEASISEDTMFIRQKTGLDVKCSTTQTSFFWDGKRLVEYLRPTSKEGEILKHESKAVSSVDTVPFGSGTTFIFSSPSEAKQPLLPATPLVPPEAGKHDFSALTFFAAQSRDHGASTFSLDTAQAKDYDVPTTPLVTLQSDSPPPSSLFKFRCC